MKKVIVKISINGNELITEAQRDMRMLYKAGSAVVRSAKRHKTMARFHVYEADTPECLLAMYTRVNPLNDKWIARLSVLCKYGGSNGLYL